MIKSEESYIEHEVRIRVMEGVHKDIKDTLATIKQDMKSQFHWTITMIFTILLAIIGLFGASIIAKLI
jgi:hypothetical protein